MQLSLPLRLVRSTASSTAQKPVQGLETLSLGELDASIVEVLESIQHIHEHQPNTSDRANRLAILNRRLSDLRDVRHQRNEHDCNLAFDDLNNDGY